VPINENRMFCKAVRGDDANTHHNHTEAMLRAKMLREADERRLV